MTDTRMIACEAWTPEQEQAAYDMMMSRIPVIAAAFNLDCAELCITVYAAREPGGDIDTQAALIANGRPVFQTGNNDWFAALSGRVATEAEKICPGGVFYTLDGSEMSLFEVHWTPGHLDRHKRLALLKAFEDGTLAADTPQ